MTDCNRIKHLALPRCIIVGDFNLFDKLSLLRKERGQCLWLLQVNDQVPTTNSLNTSMQTETHLHNLV